MRLPVGILSMALLTSISFAAQAENYKCKLPDGSVTYQDRPCTPNVSTQQVITSSNESVLISLISESTMIGLRAGAHKAANSGKMSKVVEACFVGMDNGKFYATFQHLFSENMNAGDLKAATAFFNSATGRKYAKRKVLQVYSTMGETPPEQIPKLTAAEENEIAEFTSTPAGQMLITRKFLTSVVTHREVLDRIQELHKECGAAHW